MMVNTKDQNSESSNTVISDDEINKDIEPTASGFVQDKSVYLIEGEILYYYETGFYGKLKDNILELVPEEATLLLERNRINIFHTDKLIEPYSLDKLVGHFSSLDNHFWGRYLVYKDLRGRGYVVRPGFGELTPYRRYPRGAKPNTAQSDTYIFPFQEGSFLDLNQLELIVSQAQSNRKKLVLGIVDRSGDVTYYSSNEFLIPHNYEHYEWPDDLKRNKD